MAAPAEGRLSESRLFVRLPRVYVGPDATRALTGQWGLLLGKKRPGWIDVLAFSARARPRVSEMGALRFDASRDWPVVGLGLPELEWRRHTKRLLRELVPGDVLVTEKGARVHAGESFSAARLLLDGRGAS